MTARCDWCDVALPSTAPREGPAFCSEAHAANFEARAEAHAECHYEIAWLRKQLAAAQSVIVFAQEAGRWGSGDTELAKLAIALGDYGLYLGEAAYDPARQAERQEARAAAGLSTPLRDEEGAPWS